MARDKPRSKRSAKSWGISSREGGMQNRQTLPETKMGPEKRPLEKKIPIGKERNVFVLY